MTTKYNKLDPIDHILHRPDMYVGSIRKKSSVEYISSDETFKISEKNIEFPPALLRIFIEPLSNAIDNVSRSKTKCTYIKIYVCKKTGETRILNDGDSIVVEINPDNKCYNHTMIFGQLLTSSNYDDKEDRYNISGRNGMGVKCTNVFSTHFKVTGCNEKKLFTQTWSNNMKSLSDPIVSKCKDKNFTEIVYIPDFEKFGIKKYTTDIISMYRKYCVDASMLTGIDVYFNDILIPVSNLKDYSNLFYDTPRDISMHFTPATSKKDFEVVLVPCENSSSSFTTISFVNGVYTSQGGTHVDAWSEAIYRPIVQKLSTKGTVYTIADIKKFFNLFVSIRISNPEFESQSKHKLESAVSASVKKKDIDAILKWDIIQLIIQSKESLAMKKLERKKKAFIKIEGLDPANNEGGKRSSECTLILVEGLSAKTYAAQGIEIGAFGKKGRDWFGIYALTGKLLNVRNAKTDSISKNRVISDIIKALGLCHNVDYSKDTQNLRYGKIMIITDQDCDGFHISGLIQNMIHYMFPSLLEHKSFISSMQTPIVRVYLPNKKEKVFYDEREYEKYVESTNNKNINKKYYKGLGSSSSQDIIDTFGKKIIEFVKDDTLVENMNKVFNSKNSDDRKSWLENYDSQHMMLKWSETTDPEYQKFKMSDFLNTEMIKFSLNDCKRSLPSMMDGLKESHRKTLYACILKKLHFHGKTLKVAQLAGFIAEKTAYHHGEQNLYDTITKMAHDFPGSNNIPLLFRDGQFGSRLSGGKDAANARYIHTKLDSLTRLLFRPEDDVLLENIIEDGEEIEPVYFVPILPTVLINGCIAGIGTGWSCSIPCYNPLDIIKCVKCWLENQSSQLPEIFPWYRGFTGEIKKMSEHKFMSWGTLGIKNNSKVVTELPVGMWTDNFKEFLDDLLEQKVVSKVKNYSTPKKIEFIITEGETECTKESLKLSRSISSTNMVLFDKDNKIKKFENVHEIINAFCETRMSFYIKRKKHLLDELNTSITFLSNKKRFLECVILGDIGLFEEDGKKRKSRKLEDLNTELELKKFDKHEDSYDYLLRLQFKNITDEKITQLHDDIQSTIIKRDELDKKTEKDMWLNDISEFETEYIKNNC